MRRQHKRIPIRKRDVRLEAVAETTARVSDLSMDGVGISANRRLMPGTPCMLTIGANGSAVILRGTAVWERFSGWSLIRPGQADPLFAAGIRLAEPRKDIMSRACGADCSTTRALRVYSPDLTVLLSFTERLTVLNLSYGGLLAESWNPMDIGSEHATRLFLPDDSEPVRCMLRVTSCEALRQETDRKYHIGFEFTGLDHEQTERVKKFVLFLSAV